ncbi:hypothetical protein EGH21_22475 [Halomicroarcula sp. F13]|uniref:Small CPxCG-related zinc finger protein n=1 Tax=Haloarcula rubra TaxID=2487747 RepID=A0AAW4PXA9_9EURY|nr:hypothetical protein [Halomicroarcula rubra]MBX0325787.1 hypothetical protein [Halomicroarcula rubra]
MSDLEDYVDVRELHPACVLLPCRYESCDNERWVCGPGSDREYTVCPDCGPDVEGLRNTTRVRV